MSIITPVHACQDHAIHIRNLPVCYSAVLQRPTILAWSEASAGRGRDRTLVEFYVPATQLADSSMHKICRRSGEGFDLLLLFLDVFSFVSRLQQRRHTALISVDIRPTCFPVLDIPTGTLSSQPSSDLPSFIGGATKIAS